MLTDPVTRLKRKVMALYQSIRHPEDKRLHDVMLTNMTMDEKGRFDIVVEHPNVVLLAAEVAQLFDKSGASNYFEFEMQDKPTRRYFRVTVQPIHRFDKTRVTEIMRDALTEIADSSMSASYDAPLKAMNTLIKLGYRKDVQEVAE